MLQDTFLALGLGSLLLMFGSEQLAFLTNVYAENIFSSCHIWGVLLLIQLNWFLSSSIPKFPKFCFSEQQEYNMFLAQ